jgi:hypothetical protein
MLTTNLQKLNTPEVLHRDMEKCSRSMSTLDMEILMVRRMNPYGIFL